MVIIVISNRGIVMTMVIIVIQYIMWTGLGIVIMIVIQFIMWAGFGKLPCERKRFFEIREPCPDYKKNLHHNTKTLGPHTNCNKPQ